MDLDRYFIDVAKNISLRSSDPSTRVGCIFVDNRNNIVGTGFNDFITGANKKYYIPERPMRYMLSVHAEMRAIIHSCNSLRGCRAYVTHASCDNCLKHMAEAGITEVIYETVQTNGGFIDPERAEAILRIIKATGIICRNINGRSFGEEISENINIGDLKIL